MSNYLERTTASGAVLTRPKKRINKRAVQMKKEQQEFAQKCVSYGIAPDMYRQGCISVSNEFFYLTGFEGNCAIIENLMGIQRIIPFEDACQMMLENLTVEREDIPLKLELLGLFDDTPRRRRLYSAAKFENKCKTQCITRAKEVYNGNMAEVITSMNLPKEGLRAGYKGKLDMYEFVSYRPDKDKKKPYIIEDICKPGDDDSRFEHVSFKELAAGMKRFAESELEGVEQEAALDMIAGMCPAPVEIETCMTVNIKNERKRRKAMEAETKAEQLTFAF